MSSPAIYNAYAKVNLYLDVICKRPDGYHGIETIFQSISLHDTLKLVPSHTEVEVVTAHPQIQQQEQNLVYKAAMLLRQEGEIRLGASITLEKNIPIGAGLGGGSADAAATLAALNSLWELDLDDDTLLKIAARVGSDVPFCFVGGTAAGTGRGEKMAGLPLSGERWFVIVTPPFSVSTATAYKSLSVRACGGVPEGKLTERFQRIADLAHAGKVEKILHNTMERVVLKKHPEIKGLKRLLERAGCTAALMTGSGPTVFGLVASRDEGIAVVDKLRRALPGHFVTLVTTSKVGWERLN